MKSIPPKFVDDQVLELSNNNKEIAIQLKRIADSLERMLNTDDERPCNCTLDHFGDEP